MQISVTSSYISLLPDHASVFQLPSCCLQCVPYLSFWSHFTLYLCHLLWPKIHLTTTSNFKFFSIAKLTFPCSQMSFLFPPFKPCVWWQLLGAKSSLGYPIQTSSCSPDCHHCQLLAIHSLFSLPCIWLAHNLMTSSMEPPLPMSENKPYSTLSNSPWWSATSKCAIEQICWAFFLLYLPSVHVELKSHPP